MSGSEGPGGMGFLNRLLGMNGGRGTQTRRTFVVLGCPRGGTSLVAGALHTAGVYMGNLGNYYQYEDRDFKIPPKQADQALETLAPVIRQRNRKYPYWAGSYLTISTTLSRCVICSSSPAICSSIGIRSGSRSRRHGMINVTGRPSGIASWRWPMNTPAGCVSFRTPCPRSRPFRISMSFIWRRFMPIRSRSSTSSSPYWTRYAPIANDY